MSAAGNSLIDMPSLSGSGAHVSTSIKARTGDAYEGMSKNFVLTACEKMHKF